MHDILAFHACTSRLRCASARRACRTCALLRLCFAYCTLHSHRSFCTLNFTLVCTALLACFDSEIAKEKGFQPSRRPGPVHPPRSPTLAARIELVSCPTHSFARRSSLRPSLVRNAASMTRQSRTPTLGSCGVLAPSLRDPLHLNQTKRMTPGQWNGSFFLEGL